MTHRCPDGIHRQGSPFQNPSNARVMPQKIQPSPRYSVLDLPTDSGEEPTFEDGSIRIERNGKEDFIQITTAQLSEPSSMTVGVYGTSDDAEAALGKLYECLCTAANLRRQWAEGRRSIGFQQHSTISLETLHCGLESILSERVAKTIKDNFRDQKTLLAKLGSLPINPETDLSYERNYIGSVKLKELRITVTRIDPKSGSIDVNTLGITPHTKIDAGKGTYAVASALPYKEHNKFVAALKAALKG